MGDPCVRDRHFKRFQNGDALRFDRSKMIRQSLNIRNIHAVKNADGLYNLYRVILFAFIGGGGREMFTRLKTRMST